MWRTVFLFAGCMQTRYCFCELGVHLLPRAAQCSNTVQHCWYCCAWRVGEKLCVLLRLLLLVTNHDFVVSHQASLHSMGR